MGDIGGGRQGTLRKYGADRQTMRREHPEWFQQCIRCKAWFLNTEAACPECAPSVGKPTGSTGGTGKRSLLKRPELVGAAIFGVFLLVLGLVMAWIMSPPSPEEAARRAKAESARYAQLAAQEEAEQRIQELSYCVGMADQVDRMYLLYQASRDSQGLHNALDRSALAAHYDPYQWKTANDAIAFVIRLPDDLPGMEAGKRWITEKCK